MLSEGFALLEERPGEELVFGTVGRFWRARGELCATSPVRFRAPAPSGTAKAAWNFEVSLRADGATELRTETRVLCADVTTKRRFRMYWLVIRPFSALIRREMLAAVRSAADRVRVDVRITHSGIRFAFDAARCLVYHGIRFRNAHLRDGTSLIISSLPLALSLS
jgi:hypothetical protein